MEHRENPHYRGRQPLRLTGRALIAWNVLLAVILAVLLITGSFVYAAIFVVVWVIAEVARRRESA